MQDRREDDHEDDHDHDESGRERTQDAQRDGSAALRRGWYPVIGGGTLILLLFIAASLVRRAFPSVFAPLFIVSVLGIIVGSAYVIRVLLTENL